MEINLLGESANYWNWESEINLIEEIINNNKLIIKIQIINEITKEFELFLFNGSKSQRPLFCIEGDQKYCGLWRIEKINLENNEIFCSFAHINYNSTNLWGESQYQIYKPKNFTCTETNIQLLTIDSISSVRNRIYLAPPLVFHTRISIFNIDTIDTVNQTFQADIYTELRLKHVIHSEDEEAILKLLECYQATSNKIDFLHISTVISEKEFWTTFETNQSGEPLDYVIKIRMKAQFIEKMELENFPFDIQDLNIPITFNSSIHRVVLRPNFTFPSVFQVIILLYFFFQLETLTSSFFIIFRFKVFSYHHFLM